jgi:hypothetical protein
MTTHFQTLGRRFAGLRLTCLLGTLVAWQACAQTTRTVPTEFPTIQEAIQASQDGDTVRVLPGVYQVFIITLNKSIRLMSRFEETGDESYIRDTVISGCAGVQVIAVENFEVMHPISPTISGFTITNGTAGVSVYVDVRYCCPDATTSVTVQNNIITGNGTGVWLRSYASFVWDDLLAAYAPIQCMLSNNIFMANGGPAVSIDSRGDAIETYHYGQFEQHYRFASVDCTILKSIMSSNASIVEAVAGREASVALRMLNCTCYNSGANPLKISCDPEGPYTRMDADLLNTLIWNPDGAPYRLAVSTNATFRCEHSLIGDEQGRPLSGAGNLFADPGFVDPGLGAFALQTNSPCIDAGATNSALGIVNYNGLAPDVGAIEYALPMRPILSDWQHAGDAFKVLLTTQRGRVHRLLYRDALGSGDWTAADAIAGDGGHVTLTDDHAAGQRRYYKVVVE